MPQHAFTWHDVTYLFEAAAEVPEGEREAWLHAQCGDNPALFREVSSLLSAARAEATAADQNPPRVEPSLEARRYGPWQAVRVIGAGGMGSVLLVRRADGQFEQIAALKLLAPHLAGSYFLDRFRAERQILAQLNHPHITKLLDGGITADGAPYLVMEYVEGARIDKYCNCQRLDLRSRLRIFRQVCDAVQAAHRSLIAHLDLKPSNILVTAEGNPKLLDFGTAKLVDFERGQTTTRSLTPDYASPEQLRGESVTTACDIYSLGVILHELMAGARPFAESWSSVVERATGKTDPRPLDEGITDSIAAQRSTVVAALRRQLRGDLASIVLKAMAAEPRKRYQSPADLAADIDRYLAGEAVEAHTPGIFYRTGKFARRHAVAVAFAALFVIGMTGAAVFSMRAAAMARREAARTQQISAFYTSMLASPNPSWYNTLTTKGRGVTVLDVLDELRGRIGRDLAGQPDVEVELRGSVGRMYSALGQHAQAREQLDLALRRQLQTAGRDHPQTAKLYVVLCAEDHFTLHHAEMIGHAREALAILGREGNKADREISMEAWNALAVGLGSTGELAQAEAAQREANRRSRDLFGEGGATPVGVGVLSSFAIRQGKFDEADALARDALRMFRAAPRTPVETANVLSNLGLVAIERGDYQTARPYLEESVKIAREGWGPDSAYTIGDEALLTLVRGLSGEFKEAERQLGVCREKFVQLGGSNPAYVAQMDSYEGRVQLAAGEFSAAAASLQRALDSDRKSLKASDVRIAWLAGLLGEAWLGEGRREEAAALLNESHRALLAALGPDHVWTQRIAADLARIS
jgi:serine/threonine-protein kinase